MAALAAACAIAVTLSGCGTSLVEAAQGLQAEAVSPRLVLTDPDSVTVNANGTVTFAGVPSGDTSDLTLTMKNTGTGALVVDLPSACITMATGTEAGTFLLVDPPASSVTLKTDESASFTIRFAPTTSGTKFAVVVIGTNDVANESFSFTVAGACSARPATPSGLTVSQVSGVNAVTDNTSLDVSWDAVADAASYTVTRYSSADIKITSLDPVSATSLRDTGLVPGVTFRYGVVAQNSAGTKSLEPTHVAQIVSGTASTSVTLATASTEILSLDGAYCTVGDVVAVTGTPDGTVTTPTWASSDTAVATVSDGTVTAIAAGSAVITATAQDNTGKNGSFTIHVVTIGGTGQAGLVFYDKGSYSDSWRFLEAASEDCWYLDGTTKTYLYRWSGDTKINPTTSLDVGTGKANTAAILALLSTAPAALAATSCSSGGFTDWFLPSAYDLKCLYDNLHAAGLGNFIGSGYWSSTDATGSGSYSIACIADFRPAYYLGDCTDNGTYRENVRAVRQF